MRLGVTAVVVLLGASLLPSVVRADGCMFPDEAAWRRMRERSMINEPEQKAVVFFSKGKEDLIISPSYEGPTDRFAWVIPVPKRPKLEILKGAIFHELAALVRPRPRDQAKAGAPAMGIPGGVTVLERKTVGAYHVSVLLATDGQALMKWLKANKYHLPSKAVGPITHYVKEGWTFVACRVKAPSAAKGLRTGTLAPIRLTFAAQRPVYPLRLSSANPKPFSTLVYLILPTGEEGERTGLVKLASGPGGYGRYGIYRSAALARGQKRYPTLARLTRDEADVYVSRGQLQPKDCTADYVWEVSSRRAAR